MQIGLTKPNFSRPAINPTQEASSAHVAEEPENAIIVEDSSYFDSVDTNADKPLSRGFENMEQAKKALDSVEFQKLDPFVATIAGSTSTRSAKKPKGAGTIELTLPQYYKEKFEVELGLQNGPDAPLLVILPGIYGKIDDGHNVLLKSLAHAKGMNYLVIPNAMGADALDDNPVNHPGNPGLESQMVVDILGALKNHSPEHFEKVSLAGFSYGGLLAANVVRRDEEQNSESDRLITGGMVSVSPPENLYDSMLELDSLRQRYKEGAGSMVSRGLKYRKQVKKLGYENFSESEFAKIGPGTNITEIKMADHYGSRKNMKSMVAQADQMFEHNKIPEKDILKPSKGKQRKKILNSMNYEWYSQDWFSKDSWLVERGLTPEKLAEEFSYERALNTIESTPVLNLVSADDYILNSENLATYQKLEKNEQALEKTKITDFGGHVGHVFNPEVQEVLTDFLYSTAAHPEDFKPAKA